MASNDSDDRYIQVGWWNGWGYQQGQPQGEFTPLGGTVRFPCHVQAVYIKQGE